MTEHTQAQESERDIPLAYIIHDLKELHARSTPGKWGKGQTTHHTVSIRPNQPDYRIAEFHHAADAAFCDAAHDFMPALLAALASRSTEGPYSRQYEGMDGIDYDKKPEPSSAVKAIPLDYPPLPGYDVIARTPFGDGVHLKKGFSEAAMRAYVDADRAKSEPRAPVRGLAKFNRYCRAQMCLESDKEHEPECPRAAASQAPGAGGEG